MPSLQDTQLSLMHIAIVVLTALLSISILVPYASYWLGRLEGYVRATRRMNVLQIKAYRDEFENRIKFIDHRRNILENQGCGRWLIGFIGLVLLVPVSLLNVAYLASLMEYWFNSDIVLLQGFGAFSASALFLASCIVSFQGLTIIVYLELLQIAKFKKLARYVGFLCATLVVLEIFVAVSWFRIAFLYHSPMSNNLSSNFIHNIIEQGGGVVAGLLGIMLPFCQNLVVFLFIYLMLLPWMSLVDLKRLEGFQYINAG